MRIRLAAAWVAGLCLAFATPAEATGVTPQVLGAIAEGSWALKSRDPSDSAPPQCISDKAILLQPRHAGQQCRRYILEDKPDQATVTYDCPRTGNGRTVLRKETARLVQIDTQGVVNGEPFSAILEGRSVPRCPDNGAPRR